MLRTLLVLTALVPSAVQAREVTILCDVRLTQGERAGTPSTRQYILDDERKTITSVMPDGSIVALCSADPAMCDMNYSPEAITYTMYLGNTRGPNTIRFSLNRLSGQIVETWDITAFRFNNSVAGTCQAATPANRRF